jgi:hypothetical protein
MTRERQNKLIFGLLYVAFIVTCVALFRFF